MADEILKTGLREIEKIMGEVYLIMLENKMKEINCTELLFEKGKVSMDFTITLDFLKEKEIKENVN